MDPVVRVRRGFLRTRVVAGYADHLLTGSVWGAFRPTERMLQTEGEGDLAGRLLGLQRLAYADLLRGRVRGAWRGALRFTLRQRVGRTIRFRLPRSQSSRLLELLGIDAPPARDRALLWRRVIGLALLVVGALFGIASTLAALERDAWLVPAISGTIGWLVAGSGFRLLFIRRRLPSSPGAPRSAREPFRSRPVGWLLKTAGVVYWLLVGANYDRITAWFGLFGGQAAVLIWIPAALLLYWGHRIGLRSYSPGGPSHRRPILFLRSFADDGQVSLQPSSIIPTFAGKRVMVEHLIFNPIGLIRLLLGRGGTSAEETLTRFFTPLGPVVAIGKPGERLMTGGAARFYVDDASWKAAVETELDRAQAFVLQPGGSEGIAWELEAVRRHAPPERVLLSLAPFHGDAEAFDRVAPVLRATLGASLPRRIPYLGSPAFVTFDSGWRPVVHELSYRNPFWWLLVGDAADLHYTLRPFLDQLDSEATPAAAPPPVRWGPGLKRYLTAVLGSIFGFAVIAGSLALLAMLLGIPLRDRPLLEQPLVPRRGSVVPYRVGFPESFRRRPPSTASIEHAGRAEDKRFLVVVAADSAPTDLRALAASRAAVIVREGGVVESGSERDLTAHGLGWREAKIVARYPQGQVHELTRAANTPFGVVAIRFVYRPDEHGSTAASDSLAERIFASFTLEPIAGR